MRLSLAAVFTLSTLASSALSAQAPTAPQPIAPSGQLPDHTNTTNYGALKVFVFSSVPGATRYQVFVNHNGYYNWAEHAAEFLHCAAGEPVCSMPWNRVIYTTPCSPLAYWWVRAWAPPDNYGPWSHAMPVSGNVRSCRSPSEGDQLSERDAGRTEIATASRGEIEKLRHRVTELESLVKSLTELVTNAARRERR